MLWKYHNTRTVIFHSPDDMLTKIDGSRALAAERADLVTLHEIPNTCHGLLKDSWEVATALLMYLSAFIFFYFSIIPLNPKSK